MNYVVKVRDSYGNVTVMAYPDEAQADSYASACRMFGWKVEQYVKKAVKPTTQAERDANFLA